MADRWEYMDIFFSEPGEIAEELNILGADGWEMVNFVQQLENVAAEEDTGGLSLAPVGYVAIFKRRIQT
jgi:hypothetical protein